MQERKRNMKGCQLDCSNKQASAKENDKVIHLHPSNFIRFRACYLQFIDISLDRHNFQEFMSVSATILIYQNSHNANT